MDAQHEVRWRQLDRTLWVGADEEGHVGTIEQGRRYTALDADGRVRARCRTLDHAKAVLAALQEVEPAARRRRAAA